MSQMHGDGMLANALLLVAIVSVNAQTETNVRIAGPVNNVTLITTRPVNIIVCDASRPAKQIGTTKSKQKPSSSSRSRSSLLPVNCPEDEGFFRSPISNQCLKTFMEPDHEGFWEDADRICKAAGLVLARPTEPVSLRTQLVAKFGDQSYWIGARGDGQQMRWQRNNEILDMRSPFWQPGIDEDYVTTDSCLGLSANAYVLREYPDEPYWSWDCANRFVKFPLCEKV